MLYKSRNIILCCSIVFLTIATSAAFAAQSANHTTATVVSVPNPSSISSQTASININSADITTLQKVKGISKKKAEAIISYRDKNGSFKSLEDLLKVNCRGIHKKWLDKISKFLTL